MNLHFSWSISWSWYHSCINVTQWWCGGWLVRSLLEFSLFGILELLSRTSSSSRRRCESVMNLMYWLVRVISSLYWVLSVTYWWRELRGNIYIDAFFVKHVASRLAWLELELYLLDDVVWSRIQFSFLHGGNKRLHLCVVGNQLEFVVLQRQILPIIILCVTDFICNDQTRKKFQIMLTLIVSMYALAYFWQSSTLSLLSSISSNSFCFMRKKKNSHSMLLLLLA